MKLAEIITANGKPETEIELGQFKKYKKSLLVFYRSQYPRGAEPVIMVTTVFNACQYGKIVHPFEIEEAANEFLGADKTLTDREREEEKENIYFNSIPLSKL